MLVNIKYVALAALPLVAQGCNCASKAERPNIVCIVSEDNSKRYMKLFDEERGVETPNIAKLAENGVMFSNAFSNAPVSSAARSTLISGIYGPQLSSQYHRGAVMADMPEGTKMFPAYLREAGYYTVNNAKEDYNINKGDDVWDESSRKGTWKNRKEGQPFYYVHNLATTHESVLLKPAKFVSDYVADYNEVEPFIQPNLPDTKLMRDTYKYYCKKVQEMDAQVGKVVAQLDADGQLDNTIIFYYGDNGGILPSSKGYTSEMGLNVPMIVSVPEKYKHLVSSKMGTTDDRFVSFVDLGATILNLAGIETPEWMDGESFWAKGRETEKPTWGYADRMGEKYDMVRTLRVGKMKYVRNFMPFNFDGLTNAYRFKIAAYQEWRKLFDEGKLTTLQASFFEPKAPEALYDLSNDPYEINNLANDPKYIKTLAKMRGQMVDWQLDNNDLGLYPEYVLVKDGGYPDTDKFGRANSKNIARYLSIANLQTKAFDTAKDDIVKALNSEDHIDRQWALVTCSSFGKEAKSLVPQIKKISKSDSSLENRVRAAEYLALTGVEQPQKVMLSALYETKDELEATLILNSIALLQQSKKPFKFNIEIAKLDPKVAKYPLVKSRLPIAPKKK